jgi:hypothetical protein
MRERCAKLATTDAKTRGKFSSVLPLAFLSTIVDKAPTLWGRPRVRALDVEERVVVSKPIVLFASGFAAGIAVTGLLNPVDRALFLSVSERRAFLHPANWRQPFQGLGQSVIGRAVATGFWFPLERLALSSLQKQPWADSSPMLVAAASGQIAGVANAVLLSPLAFVKYQTWGSPPGKRSFGRTANQIYRVAFDSCTVSLGGASPYARPLVPRCEISALSVFFRGLPATVLRDAAFGTATRHTQRPPARALSTACH